ncbi:hypothetical protein ACLMJK_007457 [Lecanora helva]
MTKNYPSKTPKPSPLLTLPPELHTLLTQHLPYPDALALKHTHPRLYALTPTTVQQKVSWLLERKARNLPSPDSKCVMRSDAAFCGNKEVRRIMQRRRAHAECKGGVGGCEVLIAGTCLGGKRRVGEWKVGKGMRMWVVGLVVMSLVANVWFVITSQYPKYSQDR